MGRWRAPWIAVLLALGCAGQVDSGQRAAGEPSPTSPPANPQKPTPKPDDVAPPPPPSPLLAPLRRLTPAEYDATVRDLLGDNTKPGQRFPPDPVVAGFNNDARALAVSVPLAEEFLFAAETLAAQAVTKLATLAPCAPRADEACAQDFITRFGRRAFRRPLEAEESARLLTVFKAAAARRGFAGGIEVALRTMLVSAPFLYRIEIGAPDPAAGGQRRPTSHEMASRLSYLLWGSMPDDRLLDAADRDGLRDPAAIGREAERMLADARTKQVAAHFHEQWLELQGLAKLEKDKAVYPKFNPDLRALFRREVDSLVEEAAFGANNFLSALHTSNRVSLNATLARYYGLAAPTTSSFQPVALDPNRHGGLLTLGAMMALVAHPDQTSPTLRGRFVREQLLCMPLPPPPPSVNNNAPDLDPTKSTRERYRAHAVDPACSECHKLMDPIGFAFERFDGAGLWRDTEAGRPIDTRGEAPGTDLGAFDGAVELGRRLASSAQARGCLAKQWFRFAFGRDDGPADASSMQRLAAVLAAPDANVPKVLLTLTQTDAFLARPSLAGGSR